jgi:transposase
MSLPEAELPSDPEALRALAREMQQALAARDAELYAKTLHIEKLKAQLAILKRARYGRSSEKLEGEIEQLELMIGELEEGEAESQARTAATQPAPTTEGSPRPRREPTGRKPLPDHLPRETVQHPAACACPRCGGTRLTRIGIDVTEVLEYVPSHFKVIRHERPKLSCRSCEAISEPPLPALPIERGRPGPGLLAQVLIAKYCDHLPLYRQSAIYARSGVELERSTLADWVGQSAFLLDPLAQAIAAHARSGGVLHADDTPVPVLDPGRGRTKTGRLWVLVRDERPWGSLDPPAAVYRYSGDRKGEHARALLGECRGFLHADGYAGFSTLYEPDPKTGVAPLIEIACWAHARRKLYDVHAATTSPIAKEALERIARLFAVEVEIRGQPPAARRAVRQQRSLAELDALKAFLERELARISGKSALAQAIRYSLWRWDALARFTTDGRLEMTNNAAERAIRPLALGRKNWLFAGSDTGGDRAAMIYTIIETAKLNGLDPYRYFADVLGRIAAHPINRIAELLPWNWRRARERAQAA